MKKLLVCLPIFALLITGCKNSSKKKESGRKYEEIPAKREISATLGMPEMLSGEVSFSLDFNEFLKEPSSFNPNLAKFAAIVGSQNGGAFNIDIRGATNFGNDPTDKKAIYRELGFEDIEIIDTTDNKTRIDKYDHTKVVAAHKGFKKDGNIYDVMVMSYEVTTTAEDWLSDFDIGSDTKEYYDMFGDKHPDWQDKKNHKGFDVAVTRTETGVNNYIANKLDANANKVIFVLGYSRGAALANIAAKRLVDKNYANTTVIGYSIATPATVCTDEDTETKYSSIYNVVNEDDFVYLVLGEQWGFKRYGKTLSYKISEDQSILDSFAQKYGKEYKYVDFINDEMIYHFSDKRDNLYKPYFVSYQEPYSTDPENMYGSTLDDCNDNRKKAVNSAKILGISNFCDISQPFEAVPANADAEQGPIHDSWYSFDVKTSYGAIWKIIEFVLRSFDGGDAINFSNFDAQAIKDTVNNLKSTILCVLDTINYALDRALPALEESGIYVGACAHLIFPYLDIIDALS